MRMRATELPTVPNPNRAMRKGRLTAAGAEFAGDAGGPCVSGTGRSFVQNDVPNRLMINDGTTLPGYNEMAIVRTAAELV